MKSQEASGQKKNKLKSFSFWLHAFIALLTTLSIFMLYLFSTEAFAAQTIKGKHAALRRIAFCFGVLTPAFFLLATCIGYAAYRETKILTSQGGFHKLYKSAKKNPRSVGLGVFLMLFPIAAYGMFVCVATLTVFKKQSVPLRFILSIVLTAALIYSLIVFIMPNVIKFFQKKDKINYVLKHHTKAVSTLLGEAVLWPMLYFSVKESFKSIRLKGIPANVLAIFIATMTIIVIAISVLGGIEDDEKKEKNTNQQDQSLFKKCCYIICWLTAGATGGMLGAYEGLKKIGIVNNHSSLGVKISVMGVAALSLLYWYCLYYDKMKNNVSEIFKEDSTTSAALK